MEILEFKITITKIKNILNGLNIILEMAEERQNECEDRSVEIIQSEKQNKTYILETF